MTLVLSSADVVPSFTIGTEQHGEGRARTALLDRAMAPNWRKKSSNALRRGFLPAPGLALVARDRNGKLVGTVRLWDVLDAESNPALLLGPLAVDTAAKSSGIGTALMNAAIGKATKLGHGAILLVGDPAYYERFGFSADITQNLALPGPFEKHRFLGLELSAGALDKARGTLTPNGRKPNQQIKRLASAA